MTFHSLISPDQHWVILFSLLGIALLSLYLEKTAIGSKISGAMIAMIGGFLLTNTGILPSSAPLYDITWSYFVPLAIPLLLFQANLKKIFREAGPTLIAFIFGAVGTVAGTFLAYILIPLGPEGWKMAGIFCATYIGGSINYVAVANVLDLKDPDLLSAGIAADNLMMTFYFMILFTLPVIQFFRSRYPFREENPLPSDKSMEHTALNDHSFGLLDIFQNLTIATGLVMVSFAAEQLISLKGSGILILTLLTVFTATLFPRFFNTLRGNAALATFFMQLFFVVIGASSHVPTVLKFGPILFIFTAVILSVHLLFILLFGRILHLDLREIVIASNANLGGPTTAAAMAAAKNWYHLVLPAILSGTFGYAIANFAGAIVANLLHLL